MARARTETADIAIRPATPGDAAAIARIYNRYVLETAVTFEEEAVAAQEMARRIEETLAVPLPWLVAARGRDIAGYAHASKWKGRCAYRFSVETTVYLDPVWHRRGIGSRLYETLIERLRSQHYHAAMAGIALPNLASIALHEKLGFEKVAHFREVGFKFGRWVDVGYWQAII